MSPRNTRSFPTAHAWSMRLPYLEGSSLMAPAELSPTRRQRTKTRVNWNPSYLTVSDNNQEPSQADELRRPAARSRPGQRCALFRLCSGRRRTALQNDANRCTAKSQLSGMIAGPATAIKSSSSTTTHAEGCLTRARTRVVRLVTNDVWQCMTRAFGR